MSGCKSWYTWLGFTVSLLCLWLAFRSVPLSEVGHIVAGASALPLFTALALLFLAVATRAKRWLILLEQETGLRNSFWAQSVGFLFTNVFPLRLGEPARVLVMSERCGLPIMQVAASAIVERLLDVATNVFILILVLPWMRVPPLAYQAGMSFGVLVLLGFGFLLLIVRLSHSHERLIHTFCSRFPFLPLEKIIVLWRELVAGFRPLTRWYIALQAVGWSLATWACSLGMNWSVLRAFEPDANLVEAAFMMVAVSFAVAVPSSPGFIGVFQLVGQQALVLPFAAKYNPADALAITLTAHLLYYVPTTALGIVGLWRVGESFMNLGRILIRGQAARKTLRSDVVQVEKPRGDPIVR